MFYMTTIIFSHHLESEDSMFHIYRSVFWEMLRTCREMLSLRSGKVLGSSRLTRCFECPPQSQKSHGLRSGDRGGHRLQTCRLMTPSSVKRFLRSSLTQREELHLA
ncbi:hypothetical protein AVEN_10446-1 [Araneus ventricosus]|uniref:Uncharacterized protein n=1 Tax=Araneus ventricosus TaxID=182803 RepID=A0A4Y2UGP7_ARAVE|nr:hypothetical protein AVEN_10446-1 [Araneus ventricosus]